MEGIRIIGGKGEGGKEELGIGRKVIEIRIIGGKGEGGKEELGIARKVVEIRIIGGNGEGGKKGRMKGEHWERERGENYEGGGK